MQLILNTFGASLRKKDGMFLIRAGDRKISVSPRKVQTIWLATGVHLSTDAIRLALEHHVDIALLDKHGDPYGRFWHARLGSTNLLRRRLLEVAESEDGVRLAREWVQVKIGHQADLLRDLVRTRPDRAAQLDGTAGRLDKLADVVSGVGGAPLDELRGSLMGLEGVAGREYFAALSLALPERFRFQGRSRSPARDEFNCLINYAYGVLYSLVERACLISGLDPCIGLLHTDNYNKLSLVFDLIELFRVHAERAVVTLFASRLVRQELFDQKEGGFRLNAEGRGLLLGALNEHLDRVKHHGRRRLKIRDTITYECQRLAGRLLRGLDGDLEVDLSVFDLAAEMAAGLAGTGTAESGTGSRPTTAESATEGVPRQPVRMTVLTWVLYDIADDRRRAKAARACLQVGLYRVQKSVFLGTLGDNERDELVVRLEALVDTGVDSVYAFPMCRADFAKVVLLGQAFDEKLVTDELRTLLM